MWQSQSIFKGEKHKKKFRSFVELAATELQFYLNSNRLDDCFALDVDVGDDDAPVMDNDGSMIERR